MTNINAFVKLVPSTPELEEAGIPSFEITITQDGKPPIVKQMTLLDVFNSAPQGAIVELIQRDLVNLLAEVGPIERYRPAECDE